MYDFLEISKTEAKHKPMIYVQAGEIPRICDAAECEMAKTFRHYQRGGLIVTITTDPGTRETTVKPLTLSSLMHVLAGLAIWQRYDKKVMHGLSVILQRSIFGYCMIQLVIHIYRY
ncbi:MAG: hypothetical protein IPP22_10890 [Nitrosomonas sp.]|nr:hypothetical protein [Nitrosomonas sp.]